jgi:CheY-like chemotaxis protein
MKRVLVIDAGARSRRASRIKLAACGYQVIAAGDVASALRAAAHEYPEVVVIDLALPQLKGGEVIVRLRGRRRRRSSCCPRAPTAPTKVTRWTPALTIT